MAASSSLSDLAGWTREDFANRWMKILPSLISEIEEKNETVTDIFRVIFVSIVPVVPASELEEVIFSQICDKMSHHFGSVFDSVVQTAESLIDVQTLPSGTAQELNVILEGLTNSIVSIATCLNYLSNLRTSLVLANIRSLPYCVLDLMIRSFAHCKESGQLYGQLFGHVSDHLSGLFKATRLLQTNFSLMLEKLDVSYPTEQDKEDLCYIIQKLCGICDAASRLDVKIMVALWKTVSRLSCHYRDFLLNQLDMTELLTSLCDNMSSSSSYFCQQDGSTVSQVEEGSLGKMIKILGFQMRILVTLTKEYSGYLGNSIGPIYQLVMQIKSFLPPSLDAVRLSAETREELMRHVGIGLEPLICSLIDNNEFISLVTRVHQEKSSSPSFGIARLMLSLTIAQLLPSQPDEIQTLWLVPISRSKEKPQQSLIVSLFSCVSLCYKELSMPVHIPGVVQNGAHQGQLSLYEHVVTRLCAFVVTFPVKQFAILESCLLENVLSRRQHSAMVAIDVWCFMARCGSAELCRDHCRFLMSLFTESHRTVSAECCHLVLLIRRLFRLMAPEHQAELVSNAVSFEALSVLPLDVSSPVTCRTITDRATDLFGKAVTHWTSGGVKTIGDAQELLLVLRTLHNVCQSSVVVDDFFGAEQQSRLVSQCLVLLSVLPPAGKTNRHRRLLDAITSSVFYFLSHMAVNLNNKSVVQLLSYCDIVTSRAYKDAVKLSVLEVLGAFAAKTFGPDNDQCQVLRLIPKLFSRLLGDTDIVVHQLAMEVFENFAQKTSHESFIPDSLVGNEQLQQKFISYIKERAIGFQRTNEDVESVRIFGEVVDRWSQVAAEELWNQASDVPAESSEDKEIRPPVFKRLRVAEDGDSAEKEMEEQEEARKEPSLRQTLGQLDSTVSALEVLSQSQPLPDWAVSQLSELKRRLAVFV